MHSRTVNWASFYLIGVHGGERSENPTNSHCQWYEFRGGIDVTCPRRHDSTPIPVLLRGELVQPGATAQQVVWEKLEELHTLKVRCSPYVLFDARY